MVKKLLTVLSKLIQKLKTTNNSFSLQKRRFFNKTVFFVSLNKKLMFKILAKINKLILPSFTKQGLDLAKAKKWQLAIGSISLTV